MTLRIEDYGLIADMHPAAPVGIVRVVEGLRGTVPMSVRLNPRVDYGKTAPWISAKDPAVGAGSGPEALALRADVPITPRERRLEAEFSMRAGKRACLVLTWYLSWEDAPPPIDVVDTVAETTENSLKGPLHV